MSLIINSSRNTGFETLVAAAAPASPGQDLAELRVLGQGAVSTSLQDAAGTSPQHSCVGMGSGGHQGASCPGPRPREWLPAEPVPQIFIFLYIYLYF